MYPDDTAFDESGKAGSRTKVVLLARTDLFVECLLKALVSTFPQHDVVCLSDLVTISNPTDVALVLLYGMPLTSYARVLRSVRRFHPKASIALVVEDADDFDPTVVGFVEQGLIQGVVPRSVHLDVCLAVIDLLIKGGEHFPAALLWRLRPESVDGGRRGRGWATRVAVGAGGDEGLTRREMQILNLLCRGIENRGIAERLGLAEATVKIYVRGVLRKLKVHNRTEAVARFFQ
jgi:DNA-binding NarL/FixJ family response regulator